MKAWDKNLKISDELVAKCPRFIRKGKTMPYTSANGYMFSLFNKNSEIGIRFSKEIKEIFIKEWPTNRYKSYGAIMKGYVLVPEKMFNDLDVLGKYLDESYDYVMTLEPK